MRKLELVGLDSDGRYVVLADEEGGEYAVPADDRLRAALRGDRPRLGQLEIDMDSALRPRDIQARIRAGETPAAVAVLAQVSVDKIMPFCVPVLAERGHIADLARRHHVRRKNAEGPARSLDTVVSERLRGRGIDPDATRWDAWRRDDGRWSVRTTYQSGEREHTADFIFDGIGRYSLADDDEAKWLTGEQQSTRKGPQPRETGRTGERRLSAVPGNADLLSLSDATPDDDELTDDLTAVVRAVREPESGEQVEAAPFDDDRSPRPGATAYSEESDSVEDEAADDDIAAPASTTADTAATEADADIDETVGDRSDGDPDVGSGPLPPDVAGSGAADSPPGHPVEPTPEQRRRTARRASVPSWDEIMFGKTKDDER